MKTSVGSDLLDGDISTKRRAKVTHMKHHWSAMKLQSRWRGYNVRKKRTKIAVIDTQHVFQWPVPLQEDYSLPSCSPPLLEDQGRNLDWLRVHKRILIRTLTWNLCALPPPPSEFLGTILPPNRFHIYVIGSEECERSIAQSAINPSKKNWESDLQIALGISYVPLRSHTLQAIHIIAFIHHSMVSFITDVTSAAIATGIGNTLGNKGAVALSFYVASTKFVFVNAHLEAHQKAWKERNAQFNKINTEMAGLLKKAAMSKIMTKDDEVVDINVSNISGGNHLHQQPLEVSADRVIFMGDFNYRVNGNRDIVDSMIRYNMYDALVSNDQLKISQARRQAFVGYLEPPLHFKPTYKLDIDSDIYDSSSKRRIPSWTDRILYAPKGLECLAYNADFEIKTSDHRPVYASFAAMVEFPKEGLVLDTYAKIEYTAQSQVCNIM